MGKFISLCLISIVNDVIISREAMFKNLEAAGIPCTLVLDSAIGYVMEQVDFVMVGAEGVVESGGIVNKACIY